MPSGQTNIEISNTQIQAERCPPPPIIASEKGCAQVTSTERLVGYLGSYLRAFQRGMDAFPIDGINQVGSVADKQHPLPVPPTRGGVRVQRPADNAANDT